MFPGAVKIMDLNDSQLWRTQAFIDGAWVDAEDGEHFVVDNPSSGAEIARVANCGAAETARAIGAAQAAQKDWADCTARERSGVLQRMFELMLEHREDLARIITAETGKPLGESRIETSYGASYLEWFAAEAQRIYGDIIPSASQDNRILTLKQPVGVVACITPWNFPNALLVRKLAPALATGCAIVCKPANETPLSALAVAELAQRAGTPPGVVNMLAGKNEEIGAVMCEDPRVRKLTFTGSTRVGKILLRQCAGTVKNTSMELGGNAPFLVFDDARLETALDGALRAKYRNAGQTCVCANRILVQEGIYEEFAHRLGERVAAMRQGDGMEEGVEVGPLISTRAADGVLAMIEDALSHGATATVGGERGSMGPAFIAPTVLTGVNEKMRVFREEIFGPVAPLFSFSTEAEAIAMANDTEFGLAAYCFTRDIGRVWRVAEALEYGMVGINEGAISNAAAPFGGMKESGSGREGSKYGVDDYLEIKYVCMGGLGED